MALLTVQTVTDAGIVPTYSAVSASDTFAADSSNDYILYVKNAGGSPDTVVVDDPNSANPGNAVAWDPDKTASVTNGTEKAIRIRTLRHKNASTGLVTITHSFTTSVTCAVLLLA
jgi:SOS-response transcriptional repressor LexA